MHIFKEKKYKIEYLSILDYKYFTWILKLSYCNNFYRYTVRKVVGKTKVSKALSLYTADAKIQYSVLQKEPL